MTLTLDEVRKTRFHMSRRNGYEVTDVDLFVDKVEATLIQLAEESDQLRKQLASGSGGGSADAAQAVASLNAENAQLRAQIESLQSAVAGNDLADENQRVHEQLSELKASYSELQAEHRQAMAAQQSLQAEVQQLRSTNDALSSQQGDAASVLGEENDRLRSEIEELRVRLSEATRAAAAGAQGSPLTRMIVTTSAEASPAVVRLVQLATEQAEQLVNEAQGEAQRRLDAADQKAHDLASQARTQADRIESEARLGAEKVTSEAQARANAIEAEAANRQASMFAALEAEREHLATQIESLRSFETSYRSNMLSHLQAQLDAVKSSNLQPGDIPALVGEHASSGSATPRLDALLTEQG